MRPPHLSPKDPAELLRLFNEFHLQYGMTLASWARLEESLGGIFSVLCGFDQFEGMGPALFYSGRSFATRADLLSAAIRTADLSDDYRELLRAILKKARQFSASRNQIAHGVPTHFIETKTPYQGWRIKGGEQIWRAGGVSLQDLINANANFRDLSILSTHAEQARFKSRKKQLTLLPAYLAQALALPSDAFLREEGQIDKGS
jgi:hypothetical protein